MKFPFFKTLLLTGALLLAWNCTDNTTVSPGNFISDNAAEFYVIDNPEKGTLYIAEDGTVTNAQGEVVGQYADGQITDVDGSIMMEASLEDLDKVKLIETEDGQALVVSSDGKVTDKSGNDIGSVDSNGNIVNNNGDIIAENPNKPASNANQQTTTSSASNGNNNQNNNTTSSTSNQNNNNQNNNNQNSSASNGNNNQTQNSTASTSCEGKCYDSVSGKCVEYYAQGLTGAHGEQYSYNNECVLQCWHDPNQKACADLGVASNPNQNQSSSSHQQAPSSNSQQQTPSSNSQQQTPSSTSQYSGPAQLPKIIDGNKKYGYATRYWDSCKPHCAWSGKGGPTARTCQTDGVSRASVDAASVCDGGNAGTCFDQTPQIVNDTIAYAFAATPGGGNDCGKCYMLTFTGKGSSAKGSSTPSANAKIKGKHLIVMASNIGYDVDHNQFDLMIPGGGPGIYNGCGKMGISCAGAQYGGFLTTSNFDKQKLISMCNKEYSNASLRNGCLFLANWMEGADNPEIEFVQVECPSALSAKY